MNSRYWILFVTAVFLIGTLCVLGRTGQAQDSTNHSWSAPENLSNTLTDSEYPAIVADPSGMVHVFWGENDDGLTGGTNVILYTRWDGGVWSQPTDILVSPGGLGVMTRQPAVAAGPHGRLHLVWNGGFSGQIFYSSARADEAINASAWTKPVEFNVGAEAGDFPDIAIDLQGNLHVVYATGGGVDQGIYYIHSTDNGHSWSPLTSIPGTRLGRDKYVTHPRLAVGDDGTIHVVWEWWTVGVVYAGNGVLYTRSTDSGSTWAEPLVVADGPFGYPGVATVDKQVVLLVWAGTIDQRFRFSQWSFDSGLTWSAPLQTSQVGGYLGPSGMAVDSEGIIHVGMAATYYGVGDAIVYMQWAGGRWSDPEIVLLDTAEKADFHETAVAVSEGNLVHIVARYPFDIEGKDPPASFDIYYSRRRSDSSYVPPQPLPTLMPTPTNTAIPIPMPTPTETPTPRPTVISAAGEPSAPQDMQADNTTIALLVGIGPVVLLLAIVSLVRIGSLHRR